MFVFEFAKVRSKILHYFELLDVTYHMKALCKFHSSSTFLRDTIHINLEPIIAKTSRYTNVSDSPYRHRTRIVQLYSPGGAHIISIYTRFVVLPNSISIGFSRFCTVNP